MEVFVAILLLLVLLSMFGVSFSEITKNSKLPEWAKFDPNEPWGIPGTHICDWFTRNKRLKIMLIKVAQLAIIITLLFFNFTLAVTKAFIKALSKGAKSAVKKINK